MAEFYSRNNLPKRIAQPRCSKIVNEYKKEIQKDGSVRAVVSGKTNIYEKIQAGKDDCLVYNILDRFKAGDVSVLNARQGEYGDFTEAPKTLAESQQRLIDAENYFNTLPIDVRNEFNHSVIDFLNSVGDGSVTKRHAYFTPPKVVEDALKQNAQQVREQEQIVHNVQGGTANE
ncbi:MAG: hypothetical protein E7374_02895 [Clostridiales bacterium]|nr:hypothetical protein [Clostridiales bacterium]